MLYYDYYTIYHILKDTVLLYTIYYHTILYYLYYEYTGAPAQCMPTSSALRLDSAGPSVSKRAAD